MHLPATFLRLSPLPHITAKDNIFVCTALCYDFYANLKCSPFRIQLDFGDRMRKTFLFLVLGSSICVAQATPSGAPKAAPTASTAQTPSTAGPAPTEVPPTAPVITLRGLCPDKPGVADPKSPDCQTIVTRAQFDRLVETLSPNMPAGAKQNLATDYAQMLIYSGEARKQGLQDTEHYKDMVEFLKLQLLAQELIRNMQEKAKPTSAEVEKYYNDHKGQFQEVSVKRLFIPRNRPDNSGNSKAAIGPVSPTKPVPDTQLQAEADKARARIVSGEDFDKVEKEIYEAAGFKTPPPPTAIPNWRREAVPQNEQSLFDLKPNEFTKVMIEPAGAYIYQVQDNKFMPLAELKPQIESNLTRERLQGMMQTLRSNVTPELNEAYFRGPGLAKHTEPGNTGISPSPKSQPGNSPAPTSSKAASSPTAKAPSTASANPK
jgi:PPIC-type PPIASE domain